MDNDNFRNRLDTQRDDEMVGCGDEVDKTFYGIKSYFIPLYSYIL